jgi:hypothetical protein
MTASEVFRQSNGEVTRRYYEELQKRGPLGVIATNLFRGQKTSTRAKLYRGRGYKSAAYETKGWAISNLCETLEQHGEALGFRWGWKEDPTVPFGDRPSQVIYCEIPGFGQVSFHSPTRDKGPKYAGEWDGQHASEERILAFADAVMAMPERHPGIDAINEGVAPAPPELRPGLLVTVRKTVELRFGDPDSIARARARR